MSLFPLSTQGTNSFATPTLASASLMCPQIAYPRPACSRCSLYAFVQVLIYFLLFFSTTPNQERRHRTLLSAERGSRGNSKRRRPRRDTLAVFHVCMAEHPCPCLCPCTRASCTLSRIFFLTA